jgi:hypothetical protein
MYEEGFSEYHIGSKRKLCRKILLSNIDEKENQININDILNFFYEHKKRFNSRKVF